MNNIQLDVIFNELIEDIKGNNGHWQFIVGDTQIICLTDELHNRMRIMTPIIGTDKLTPAQTTKCLEANFHTALDIKYAISDGVVWAVFMHPLKELTKQQVEDAIQQVYAGAQNFGTSYSSSNLYFPTKDDRRNSMN
jgi:hypothetical protein